MQKDHILQTLGLHINNNNNNNNNKLLIHLLKGIMTRAANNVANDSSKSINSNQTISSSKKFGHLHIIFRDW